MHEYDEGATDYNPIIDQMTKARVKVISLIEQSLIFVTTIYSYIYIIEIL